MILDDPKKCGVNDTLKSESLEKVGVDLESHCIHLSYGLGMRKRTLSFNTKSREFYLALISLIIIKMKEQDKTYVWIKNSLVLDLLEQIDLWINGSNKSDNSTKRLEKIRKAWTYEKDGLKNLTNASRFRIQGQGKTSATEDFTTRLETKIKSFEEDIWSSLIHYEGDPTNFKYCFAVSNVGLTLKDVTVYYKDNVDIDAWKNYLRDLEAVYNENTTLIQNFHLN
jgi:hypothetical protein